MISIKELKKSYIRKLRETVPDLKIYSNAIEEGYETPSLFVQMIPLVFRERVTANTTHSSYMFETTLMQQKKDDAEQLEIMEKIRDKVGDHLCVEKRLLLIQEPEIQYTGQTRNIIQFVFKVDFLENCRQLETEQTVREIEVKEMVNNGHS